MSYLAIDLAIWERLVGAPLDQNGRPVVDSSNVPTNRLLPGLIDTQPNAAEEAAGVVGPPRRPSYGVRIPLLKHSGMQHRKTYRVPNTTLGAGRPTDPSKDLALNSYKQIAVFPQNIEGLDCSQVWPAVTFYWLDTYPEPSLSPYGGYDFVPAPSAADVTVSQPNSAETQTGKDRVAYVPRGDARVVRMVIRVYSKSDLELKLICDSVERLFPKHTALFVGQADGSEQVCSMSLVSVENLDPFGVDQPRNMVNEREYSRAYLYEINVTTDNSLMVNGGGLGQEPAAEEGIILSRWLHLQHLAADEIQRTLVYGTEISNGQQV